MAKVSISSSEVFKYHTGISGDEEMATITQHPRKQRSQFDST
ncbi:hypothetical protein [Fodinibius halophilus]|nr:hypothetical protein [Fodinibius halophilus]